MDETAAPPPPDEALYQQTLQELKSPRPASMGSLLFVVLMLVFVAGAFVNLRSVSGVLLLTAVIVVHEAGHALGMRLFGFRDVQMFFIPFFGAAVSGRPRGTSAWKDAVVTLLGPLPGIFAGLALLIFAMTRRHPSALHYHGAEVLLLLNGFNLLPFGFLDGGRFLERVLFSRHRVLEVAFQAVGYLLLGAIAVQGSMYVLGFFALVSMFALPARWRTLSAAAALRRQLPSLAPDPDQLGEADARALFAAAREAVRYPANERPASVAQAMESILHAMKRAPGVLASAGLVLLYGFALVCAVVGGVLLAGELGSVNWQPVQRPGWRAEFPREPLEGQAPARPGRPAHAEWRAVVDGTERFTVSAGDGTAGADWMRAAGEHLAEDTGTKLVRTRPVEIAGRSGLEFELSAPDRIVRARVVASGSRQFQVVASAPRWGESQRRFLESFTLVDSLPRP